MKEINIALNRVEKKCFEDTVMILQKPWLRTIKKQQHINQK